MENLICLDTDILVDFLRNKQEISKWIKDREKDSVLASTTINVFELYYGAYLSNNIEKNVEAVDKLTARLKILNLNTIIVKKAGKIKADLEKSGEQIDFRDILIGSTAMFENFNIKTNFQQKRSSASFLVGRLTSFFFIKC